MATNPVSIRSASPTWWAAPRMWSPRRWGAAAVASVVTLLVLGLPTDVIPNPVFGRQGTPVTWWSYPVLAVTAVLSGLLLATYVRNDAPAKTAAPNDCVVDEVADAADRPSRVGGIGGMLTFFAVGCPICNKVVVLALGTVGAVKWFAPVQPVLGLVSIALLAWSLRVRLRGEIACPVDIAPTERVESEQPA